MARAKAASKAAGTRQSPSPAAGSPRSTSSASAQRGPTAEKTSAEQAGTDASFLGQQAGNTLPERETATSPFRPHLRHPRYMTRGCMYRTLLDNGVDMLGKKLSDDDLIELLCGLGFDVGDPPTERKKRGKKAHVDQRDAFEQPATVAGER